MGWKYSTETDATEVERRTTETLDDQLRFVHQWQERARESMRKLSFSARPSAAVSFRSRKREGDGSAGS